MSTNSDILCYLNGQLQPLADARISVVDRGFMFGDGVYEVVRVYAGKIFLWQDHAERLGRSLDSLRIGGVDIEALHIQAEDLLKRQNLLEASVYFQVTRGSIGIRSHAFATKDINPYEDSFPTDTHPTALIFALPFSDSTRPLRENGCAVVTQPEVRWGRCDIKSINLLGNVLAAQHAKEAGVYETLFVNEDELVVEGSHTNFFAVVDGTLRTMPKNPAMLPGITRHFVLSLAAKLGIPCEERPISKGELAKVQEAFLTGTTTEVMPIIKVNDQALGNGSPGPVTRKLQQAFRATAQP